MANDEKKIKDYDAAGGEVMGQKLSDDKLAEYDRKSIGNPADHRCPLGIQNVWEEIKAAGPLPYERALEIALDFDGRINHCQEYDIGYMFLNTEWEDSLGGWDTPFVVMKNNGEVITHQPFMDFYCIRSNPSARLLREYDIDSYPGDKERLCGGMKLPSRIPEDVRKDLEAE